MNSYNSYGYARQYGCERCNTYDDCKPTSALPERVAVAMAYVPYQECNDVYPCEKALKMGTVFPVLDKPFLAGCCR